VRTTAISAFIPQGILEFSAAEDEALALLETSFSATVRRLRRRCARRMAGTLARTALTACGAAPLWSLGLPQGRASHAYRLMCLFPSFARQYQMVYETLLYGPGPLPYDWRLYLAIMVRPPRRSGSRWYGA